MSFPLPQELRGPGVFIQEGRMVGWTFSQPADRGYLWAGPEEGNLTPGIRVDEFYFSSFSESREAHFYRVLAMGREIPPAERLKALAHGFSLAALFADEDLPQQIRLHPVVMEMHSLASGLTQQRSADEVVRILDEQVLAAAGDPNLVEDAVIAVAQFQDYGRAIQYLDRLNKNIFFPKGQTPPELGQLRPQIYKDWLRKIIEKGSYSNGTVVFEEAKRAFPDDPELQLLGVEVALAEQDWKGANELLRGKDYPPALKDWAARLEERIKNQEDETGANIRFNPGEQIIPVEAYINGSVLQKFIIDTGASTSSIPKSSLEALRIKVDETTPVKAVQSIAEVAIAYEVTLDSVELSGYRVNGLKALVIDLPGYKDYGLLGLNFLDNFRVEIDRNRGILRLKKR